MNQNFMRLAYLLLFVIGLITSPLLGQNCSVNAGVDATQCNSTPLSLNGNESGLITVHAVWSQVGGPAVTITNPSTLNSSITGFTTATTYTFKITATCQDAAVVSDQVTYTINVVTISNAGTDLVRCPGNGVANLSGNAPGAGETATWSVTGTNSAGLSFVTATSPTTSINLTDNSVGNSTARWRITHTASGCFSDDNAIITNRGGDAPINAGVDYAYNACNSTTTYTLGASVGGNGVDGQFGTWSVTSGPNSPTFSNPTNRAALVSNLLPGVYTLRWTVQGPCLNGSDEMVLTVVPPAPAYTPPVITSGNQIFCDGRNIAVLTGSVPTYSYEVGYWVQTVGAATITSLSNYQTDVTGLAGVGSYTFVYHIYNNQAGCDYASVPRTISYNTTVPALNVGADKVLACAVNTASITYASQANTATQYRILSVPGGTNPVPNWSNAGASSQSVSALNTPGLYVVNFKRNPTGVGICPTVYDDVNIMVSHPPTASNAGTDQILACNVDASELAGNQPIIGNGSWSQLSGPNAATFSNANLRTAGISGLESGIYSFRWTIDGGNQCPPNQDDVLVYVSVPFTTAATSGVDQIVCNNSPVQLNGNDPPNSYEIGTWTAIPSTGITFSDIHDPKSMAYGLASAQAYKFVWTVVSACTYATDTCLVTSTVVAGPAQANAGPDQCLINGTAFANFAGNAPSPSGVTGQWTKITGPAVTIATPTLNTSAINFTSDGIYQFEWALSRAGCNTTRDTIDITISQPVTSANASTDQSICALSGNLAGNSPTVGTGQWSQILGPGGATIVSPNSPTSSITGLVNASYTFRWTISNGICLSFDDVDIDVAPAPTAAVITSPNTDICGSTTTNLTANAVTSGTGTWSLLGTNPNNPTIANPTANNITVTSLSQGTYQFKWTTFTTPFCSQYSDTVTINVVPPANAGPDQNALCNVTSANLSGLPVPSFGTWTQSSGPTTATITSTGPYSAIATNLSPSATPYVFTYSINSGLCNSSDNMTVTTTLPPTSSNAGVDQGLCNATSAVLAGNAPLVGAGTWSKISGPGAQTFVNAATYNTTINTLTVGGTYVLRWRITNGGCVSDDLVTITSSTLPTTATGTDITTCPGASVLTGNTPVVGVGTWTQVSGPNTAFIAQPLTPTSAISSLIQGDYVMRWSIVNGYCAASTKDINIHLPDLNPTGSNAGSDFSNCSNINLNLPGNNPSTGTGTWTQVSGPSTVNFLSNNSYNTQVTGYVPGTYRFRWNIVNGMCESADSVDVLINAAPNPSVSGNAASCANSLGVAYSVTSVLGNTYSWTVTGGSIATGQGSNAITVNWGTSGAGNVEVTQQVTATGCSSSNDKDVTINPLPSPSISGDNDVCSGETNLLYSTTDVSGHTYSWVVNNGSINAGQGTNQIQVTWTASGNATVTETITATNCSVTTSAYPVTYGGTGPIANAGTDVSVCNLSSADLSGNVPSSGTGVWSKFSGPGTQTFVNASSNNTTVNSLNVGGSYVFSWKITDGGCVSEDFVNVVSNALPTTASASDITTCPGSTTLTGNTPLSGIGTWTQISGPNTATITSSNNPTSTLSNLVQGAYVFRWSIVSGNCAASIANINVSLPDALPTSSNAGGDFDECPENNLFLAANSPTTGTGSWSQVSGPSTVTFLTSGSPNTQITGQTSGTYEFRWNIVNGICSSADTVSVLINAQPNPSVSGDASTCANSLGEAYSVTSVAGNTYNWVVSGGSIATGAGTNAITVNWGASASGNVAVTQTVTATNCSKANDLDVTINPLPTPSISGDIEVCPGETNVIYSTPDVSGHTYSWTVNGGNITNGLNTHQIEVTWTNAVSVIVTESITVSGCSKATVPYTVSTTASATVADAGSDQNSSALCDQTNTNLDANEPTTGSGTWTILSGTGGTITNSTLNTSSFSGLTGNTYTLQWSISNAGCPPSTDQVMVVFSQNPSLADAGANQTSDLMCNVTSTNLTASTPAIGSGSWSIVSGNGGSFGNSLDPSSQFNGVLNENYVIQWTVSNNPCPANSDQVNVSFYQLPGISVDSKTDVDCNGNNSGEMEISGSGGAAPYTYMIVGVDTNSTGLFTNLIANTYQLKIVDGNSCVQTANNLISEPAVLSISIDSIAHVYCVVGNTGYIAVRGVGGTADYEYDFEGSGFSNDSVFDMLAAQDYSIQIRDSKNCTATLDTAILFYSAPPTADAGSDQINGALCGLTTANLSGNTPPSPANGAWTIFNGGLGSFVNSLDGSSEFSGIAGATYKLVWTISATSCSTTTDTVLVTFDQNPTTAAAGQDLLVCLNSPADLQGNIPTIGIGNWTQVNGASTINLTSQSNGAISLSGLVLGSYTFRYTISNGICPDSPDEMSVEVEDCGSINPRLGIAKSAGTPIQLPDGTFDVTYTIYMKNMGAEDLDSLTLNDNLVRTITRPSEFHVSNMPDASGQLYSNPMFNGVSDTSLITLESKLAKGMKDSVWFTINISPNGFYGPFYNTATGTGRGIISGTRTSDISNDGNDPDKDGEGDSDKDGDGDPGEKDPTPVKLTHDIIVYDGMSPNGDGINDYLVITTENVVSLKIRVFNRWGNVVYEKDQYENEWDGTSNIGLLSGQKVPEGTYFVIVEPENTYKPFVKAVTIKY